MLDILTTLSTVAAGLDVPLRDAGFHLFYPEGADKKALPVVSESDRRSVIFEGNGCVKIEYAGTVISLMYTQGGTDATQAEYSSLLDSLLDPGEADERDIKYVIEEFSQTVAEKFANGQKPKVNKKAPAAISKTAVKNGAYYDMITFGNRFTTVYPELRPQFKENCDTYGEFLPEDFFKNYGTPAVLATIRENNPQKMKKLFNLLNDIYDNGTNDLQSLIAVSILGTMYDNDTLLANCTDYMGDDLCVMVIRVNKYLGSNGSKGMRMRLDNPPRYKPKKQKKNLMSNLMGQ